MRTKVKNYLVVFSLLVVLVITNLFSVQSVIVKADGGEKHFGNIQPYSVSAGTETINFTNREEEYTETTNGVPLYYRYADLENSCGATAGAIVVGFYDKYYEELIPNYTGYFPATGKYKTNDKIYIPALLQELYTLMRINVDDVGVSEADCINGLRTYVQNKNRTINYTSLKSASKLNESSYFNSISSNKPVLLFNTSTELVTLFVTSSDSDLLNKSLVTTNHVYVGYGYSKIRYYNGNNNFRTDTYIKVACGEALMTHGFILISSTAKTVSHSWLDNAYSVAIS